jgi:hypothetical protein
MASKDLEANLKAFEQRPADRRYGIHAVAGDSFMALLQLGVDESSTLLKSVVGAWSLRLHAMGQAMENQIPNYQPYVVSAFDADQITENLLKKQWEPFVASWSRMSKMLAQAKAPTRVDNFCPQIESCGCPCGRLGLSFGFPIPWVN